MSSIYTPTPGPLGGYTIPSDGDTVDAASVNVALEALGDMIYGVAARNSTTVYVSGATVGGITPLAVALTTADYPSVAASPVSAAEVNYGPLSTGLQFATVNTGASTARIAVIRLTPFLVPYHGYTLASLSIRVFGAAGHGALPALMPKFLVRRVNWDTGAAALNSSAIVTDSSANVAAYQANHLVTYTCNQNNVLDLALYEYELAIQNEGGTNAVAFLEIGYAKLSLTAP